MEIKKLLQELPFYEKLTEDQKRRMESRSMVRHYEKNSILHDHQAECLGMVVLLEGQLRVTMQSDDGREVTIYTMEPGDTDILSASCVINQITFDSMMFAAKDSDVLIIPAAILAGMKEENVWLQNYIYEIGLHRFSDAMWTIQQILFMKIDQRVASALLDEYARTDDTNIALTQEEIARTISSAREVVARTLKRMEKDGLLKVGRGNIELLDPDGLEDLLG